jgi:hypothetical protein
LADNVNGAPSISSARGVSIYIGIEEENIDFWERPLCLSLETTGSDKLYLIGGRDDSDEYILVDEIRNTEGSLSIWPWMPSFITSEYSNIVSFAVMHESFMLNNSFRRFAFRIKITTQDTDQSFYSDWYTLISWHENQDERHYYYWLTKGKNNI